MKKVTYNDFVEIIAKGNDSDCCIECNETHTYIADNGQCYNCFNNNVEG